MHLCSRGLKWNKEFPWISYMTRLWLHFHSLHWAIKFAEATMTKVIWCVVHTCKNNYLSLVGNYDHFASRVSRNLHVITSWILMRFKLFHCYNLISPFYFEHAYKWCVDWCIEGFSSRHGSTHFGYISPVCTSYSKFMWSVTIWWLDSKSFQR